MILGAYMAMMQVVTTHSAASVLGTRVSKRGDVATRVRTGRDYEGVSLNRNWGAISRFNRGAKSWREMNAPSSDRGHGQQGLRIQDPRGSLREPRWSYYVSLLRIDS